MAKKLLISILLFITVQGIFAQISLNNNDKNNCMISFSAGLGKFNMKNINDIYFDQFTKPLGAFDDNINSGLIVNLRVKHKTLNKVKLGLGINFYQAIVEKEYKVEDWVIDRDYYQKNTFKTTAIIPEVLIEYSIIQSKNSIIDLGFSGLYGFGKSVLKFESEEIDLLDKYELTSNGLGYKIYISLSIKIYNNFGFGIETGYKSLITSDLEDKDGNKWIVAFTDNGTPMNLDFTGIYFLGNIFINI